MRSSEKSKKLKPTLSMILIAVLMVQVAVAVILLGSVQYSKASGASVETVASVGQLVVEEQVEPQQGQSIQLNESRFQGIKADVARVEEDLETDMGLLKIAIEEKQAKDRFISAIESKSFSRSGGYKAFLKLDLTIPSGYTEAEYLAIFGGTKMEPLVAPAVKAEKDLGVNSLYILAHAAEESRWGADDFAITRHNYFGYGAIDSNPTQAFTYETVEAGVFSVVTRIRENYLTPTGKFYSKKQGPTLTGMGVRYASNPNWGTNIAMIMEKISEKLD